MTERNNLLRSLFVGRKLGDTVQIATPKKFEIKPPEEAWREFYQSGGRLPPLYDYELVTLTPELAAELQLTL